MTQKSLYYDINDGILGFQDENGYIIPVKTSATLYPGQIKIENGNLWIKTEFSENGWEPVTDTSGKPAKFPDEQEIARRLNEKQDRQDNDLKTVSKTIVAAINELKTDIDYVSYSADYPKGSNEIKQKLYKTLMPGTYKITASVECSPEGGVDPYTGACFCLGSFSSPNTDVECIKSFGDQFTITETTDVYLLYADFYYAKECAETEYSILGVDSAQDVTVTIINPQVIALNSTQLISIENDKLVLKTKNAYNQVISTEEINVVGKTGASCSALLDDDGNLQITNISSDGAVEVITKNIKGQNGADGQTPYISTSGTWIIGNQDTGIQAKGQDGINGKDGHTYTPSVDFNGNLSWRISDLEEIPSPINIKGPKGDTGEKGENGKGFEYSFPVNPKLGDTFIWGGESGLNDNCFLGYVMTGQQYVYSQLPSKLGLVFANEKTCLVPMHVMIYIPDLLQTDLMSVQFDRSTQIQPLAFNEDQLVESLTTTTNALGKEEKYMSWAVSYGLTDLQIKQLQPYIINIAKSIFDNKVTEYTTNYTSTYQMPKYLQGSAMKCKYSNFLEGGTIFNKLFTYLQENPSNIFTGLQQAIADKLSENADYNPDVYIIPIQAVDDSNLSKSWISEMPELPEGWAPCDSVLHNGFNTNQVGNIYEIPEIGGGDTEM